MTLPAHNPRPAVYISDLLTAEQSQALASRIMAALKITNRFEVKLVFDKGRLKYISTEMSFAAPPGAPAMDEEK